MTFPVWRMVFPVKRIEIELILLRSTVCHCAQLCATALRRRHPWMIGAHCQIESQCMHLLTNLKTQQQVYNPSGLVAMEGVEAIVEAIVEASQTRLEA